MIFVIVLLDSKSVYRNSLNEGVQVITCIIFYEGCSGEGNEDLNKEGRKAVICLPTAKQGKKHHHRSSWKSASISQGSNISIKNTANDQADQRDWRNCLRLG